MPDHPLLDLTDGGNVLAALREVDHGSLYFTPGGLAGPLAPEHSAHIFATWMGHVTLVDEVPDDIRRNFDRVRKLFLYGLLERDLFAVAGHEAHLVLEGALRHRFVSLYMGQIPIWRDGVADILAASSFHDYYARRPNLRRCQLRTNEGGKEQLPFSYPSLYSWARRRGLLGGQRNVGVFASLVNLRNHVAHPESYSDDLPPWVVRLLVDVAEIINKLWGRDTDGGRLFPGPVQRRLRCAALSPDRTAAVTFGSLNGVQTEERTRDWTFALFLAAEREELVDFDWEASGQQRFKHAPGFQMTDYPTDQIIAPTSIDEVLRFISANNVDAMLDRVPFQDRLFFIRLAASTERPEFPRAANDVAKFDKHDADTRWFVVRADFPMDAWVRTRDQPTAKPPQALATEVVATLTGDDEARAYAQTIA